MLQHEESLPPLPVPSLRQTAERYLRSVRPLLNPDQYANTTRAVDSFVESSGLGPVLQRRLEARRQDPNIQNWLSEWWNQAAYMAYREPVIPSTSYFFSFLDDPLRKDPIKRAAAVSTAVLEFKREVDEGTLIPDYVKDTPQTMDGYRYMFNSCRIPSKPCDYTETSDPQHHKHILVIRNNRFFKVAHEHRGIQLTTAELEEQYKQVYALATGRDDHGVGILTTENRDVWADARQRLAQGTGGNREALADIQSASFVVCLDDAAPSSLNDRARQYFLGSSANRWYDKPVTFIICDSGTMGYYGEHSLIDGGPVLRLINSVLKLTMREYLDYNTDPVRSDIPHPQPIRFGLTTSNINDIEKAHAHFNLVKRQQKLHAEYYPEYGSKVIKSLGCSPDAYVQLVIQLAYRLFRGRSQPTYEAVSTRGFRNARTETCRIVTAETVAFCDAMQDPLSTNETRRVLFKRAMDTMISMQKLASKGEGVDRHLFGLQHLIRKDEEVPAIFTDPAYTYSQKWVVTTSQVSSELFHGFGFAQAIPDGLGIAYTIKENSMHFSVASRTQDCEQAGHLLSQAATSVRSLMRGD